jgi:hypothetical protein
MRARWYSFIFLKSGEWVLQYKDGRFGSNTEFAVKAAFVFDS